MRCNYCNNQFVNICQHCGPRQGQQQIGHTQQYPFGLNEMSTPTYILDILNRLDRIESKLVAALAAKESE